MSINVDKLTAPISAEGPCGVSLEYNTGYVELERMTQGTPERQVGTTIIPAVEPNWKDVLKRCQELLDQTKDLRLLIDLHMAVLKLDGLVGLRSALTVLKVYIEKYWDSFFPQMDDEKDPTERLNILRAFASRAEGRPDAVLVQLLREIPLVKSAQMGQFGLKDIAIASGEIAPADPAAPRIDQARIDAAAKDSAADFLTEGAKAAAESAELVSAIEKLIDDKVGAGQGIDFKDFRSALNSASKHLAGFLSLKGLASPVSGDGADAPGPADATTKKQIPGDIQSTKDVVRMIDKICEFYARTEPSSPVPIVLRRAQRLVDKNFWQILTDMSPSALDAIKAISGTDGPEKA